MARSSKRISSKRNDYVMSSRAVMTPLAAAVIAALHPTGPALGQEESGRIDEILVTATKREMNLQDVPHSIDVLSAVQLERMGAMDLDATVRALPSVHLTALQPGQNQLTMRGIAAEVFEYVREAQVAVYLDEQPMTSNAQQVGFRNIDMERVESLPGPQGTLFGASSQTGTIRYITNKPLLDRFEGEVEGRFGSTSGGADSWDFNGMINIPVVEDKLAIRAVAYSSHDGGYVDNVFGTSFTGNYDNADLVEKDHNEYDVDGGRIHVKWDLSDRWSTLFSFVAENTSAPGAWDSDAALDDYQVTRFFEEFRDDDWTSTSLTVNGDLGFADLSFTATHFARDIVYEYDLMAYSQARDYTYGYWCNAGYFYSCVYYAEFLPSYIFNDQEQERDAFELRFVSKGDTRFQWMVGAYYEDFVNQWFYGAKIPGWQDTIMGYAANFYAYYYGVSSNYYNNYTPNPNQVYPLPATDIGYNNQFDQNIKQTAIFGELSYDLTDNLTAFGGMRWAEFDRSRFEVNLFPGALLPFGDRASGDGSFLDVGTDSDTIFKAGLRYNFNDAVMVYGLYSQGFRVGGSNSQRAASTGLIPLTYDGDFLNNYELGLKSQFAGGRVTLNASVYFMEWEDYMQDASFDEWWLGGTVNAGDAEATGLEAQLRWQASDRLTFSANLSLSDTEFQDDFCLNFADNVNLGCDGTVDPFIEKGMFMPNAPEAKAFASIYYEVPDVLGAENIWFYYDFAYQDESWAGVTVIREQDQDGRAPDRTISNLAAGVSLGNQLDVTIHVNNLFNQDGYQFIWTGEGGDADVFSSDRYQRQRAQDRPRTIWLSLRKGFGNR